MNANVAIGGLMLIVGIGVTAATAASASPGGSYLIAWGAIVFGTVLLFRGLLASPGLVSDTASEQPEERIASVNARLISGSISGDDYPSAALRDEAQGRSVVSFTVDNAGAVRDAEILQSSGHQALDGAACDLIQKRFRFEPALDQTGKPLPQRRKQAIDWRLPEYLPEELYSEPAHADADSGERSANGEPWRVLSSATTWMEVFRMTDEERTVMDLVRLSGATVELLRAALDGPAWIYSPPPPMGVTEDGVKLWEPEERSSTSTSLETLPEWAEKYRSQIIQYLREKEPDDASMAAEEEDPEGLSKLNSMAVDSQSVENSSTPYPTYYPMKADNECTDVKQIVYPYLIALEHSWNEQRIVDVSIGGGPDGDTLVNPVLEVLRFSNGTHKEPILLTAGPGSFFLISETWDFGARPGDNVEEETKGPVMAYSRTLSSGPEREYIQVYVVGDPVPFIDCAPTACLINSVKQDDIALAARALAAGANPNVTWGESLVTWTRRHGNERMAELLTRFGAGEPA